MSGGSGGDFAFEDTVMKQFPGAKVVTLDCFMGPETAYGDKSMPRDPSRLLYVEKCLHGPRKEDLVAFPPNADVVTYPELAQWLKKEKQVDYFDIHKLNIEAFEYPTYGHIMRDVDSHMAHTKQIFLEMHRHGMADHGLSWDSLMLCELLFATFYSGGYHAVSMEKWHDATSASDFVFVNQTWFLESELAGYEGVWTAQFPMQRPEHIDKIERNFDWSVFTPRESRSVDSGMQEVEFHNTLDVKVELLWIGNSDPQLAAIIPPKSSTQISSYKGHRFKYRNAETMELNNADIEIRPGKTSYYIE